MNYFKAIISQAEREAAGRGGGMVEERRLRGKVDEPLLFVTREEFREFRWKVQQALATVAELEVSQGAKSEPQVRIQEVGQLVQVLKGISQNLDELTKVIGRVRWKDPRDKGAERYNQVDAKAAGDEPAA